MSDPVIVLEKPRRKSSFSNVFNIVTSIAKTLFGGQEALLNPRVQEVQTSTNSETDNNGVDSNEVAPSMEINPEPSGEIIFFSVAQELIPGKKPTNILNQTPQSSQQIGKGSFSIVKKEKISGVDFAVKYFIGPLNAGQIAKIRKEIEFNAKLKHTNIVKYIGYQSTQNPVDNIPFCLVMELCSSNLDELIHNNKSKHVSPDVEVLILRQIASGLEYLHSKGVIHRDVKPKNILIRQNGTIAIGDFGVSKYVLDAETRNTVSTGDIFYSPPECFLDIVSFKTDVWSFGVVMWEFLMREYPFKGVTPLSFGSKLDQQVIKLQLSTDIASARPELNAIFNACCNHNADLRPTFTQIQAKLTKCK